MVERVQVFESVRDLSEPSLRSFDGGRADPVSTIIIPVCPARHSVVFCFLLISARNSRFCGGFDTFRTNWTYEWHEEQFSTNRALVYYTRTHRDRNNGAREMKSAELDSGMQRNRFIPSQRWAYICSRLVAIMKSSIFSWQYRIPS